MMPVVLCLLGIGILFEALGVLGLYRFPDVYTRMHGATKCTTFGSIFICLGAIAYGVLLAVEGQGAFGVLSLHVLVALLFLLVTNPAGAHAIARAAHRSGIKPALAVVDRLEEARK
jgi:multicomponent Na+:H+ antiporter subunit G